MVNGYLFTAILCCSTASIFADNPTRGYLIINMGGQGRSLEGYSFYLANENGHKVLLNRINELPSMVANEQFTQNAYYHGATHIGGIRGDYFTRTSAPTFFFFFDLPTGKPYEHLEDQEPDPSYYRLDYIENISNCSSSDATNSDCHPSSYFNTAFETEMRDHQPINLLQFSGSDLRWWTDLWSGYIASSEAFFPDNDPTQEGPQRPFYTNGTDLSRFPLIFLESACLCSWML